jgi:hypothetical protein
MYPALPASARYTGGAGLEPERAGASTLANARTGTPCRPGGVRGARLTDQFGAAGAEIIAQAGWA